MQWAVWGCYAKTPQAGWLKEQKLISHILAASKFSISCQKGLALARTCSGLQKDAFLMCPYVTERRRQQAL